MGESFRNLPGTSPRVFAESFQPQYDTIKPSSRAAYYTSGTKASHRFPSSVAATIGRAACSAHQQHRPSIATPYVSYSCKVTLSSPSTGSGYMSAPHPVAPHGGAINMRPNKSSLVTCCGLSHHNGCH
eukprot:scaffold612248_cov20-Prasinocladus_malaysianus.AAC.1